MKLNFLKHSGVNILFRIFLGAGNAAESDEDLDDDVKGFSFSVLKWVL